MSYNGIQLIFIFFLYILYLYFRKKAVEMELAKCKVDIMSLNSQLLDVVQQKFNLSQQLEAWQVGQEHHKHTPPYTQTNQDTIFKHILKHSLCWFILGLED